MGWLSWTTLLLWASLILLKPGLFKDLKVEKAGVELLPAAPLVLESKACTHNYLLQPKENIDSRVLGSSLHSAWLVDRIHKLFNALLV